MAKWRGEVSIEGGSKSKGKRRGEGDGEKDGMVPSRSMSARGEGETAGMKV